MAQRRMFSPQIIDSDAFLDMSSSAQSLYFHLGMRADDDGFVGNPKKILRIVGGNDDDLKILLAKRFILTFESGVIVIKHWRINNLVRKDWYKETVYLEEKNQLKVKENGAYTELVNETTPKLAQVRSRRLGKVRLGKVSIGKDRLLNTATSKNDVADNVAPIMKVFEGVNPTINYGNKTQRKAVTDLVEKFGYEKTLSAAQYAVSVQGQPYAPTITTPYQLKEKLGQLIVYKNKDSKKVTLKNYDEPTI